MERRRFLVASAAGVSGYSFAAPGAAAARSLNGRSDNTSGGTARSTILFFLSGGASHIDTWDMKPNAPLEYRGPFQPVSTSAPGVRLCEHLPLLRSRLITWLW
ncbi:MAG UNVERIFIED_CONTAM: DUF1501 domain-containing protein [Planctomycetaceae bacterium]|jgi:hypothetical protein